MDHIIPAGAKSSHIGVMIWPIWKIVHKYIVALKPRCLVTTWPSGPGPKWARAQVGQGSSGPGPKWARAQVGQGPSGPGPKGAGPKWARAQVGQGPSGPGPKWARAQVGQGPSGPRAQIIPPMWDDFLARPGKSSQLVQRYARIICEWFCTHRQCQSPCYCTRSSHHVCLFVVCRDISYG